MDRNTCIFLATFLLLIASCSLEELTPEQQRQVINHHLTTKSVGTAIDSLEMVSRIQSDKEIILMNQLWFRDGKFILELSKEDAESLGIPNELYDKYSKYVEKINNSLNK